jgi:hypothetical protein
VPSRPALGLLAISPGFDALFEMVGRAFVDDAGVVEGGGYLVRGEDVGHWTRSFEWGVALLPPIIIDTRAMRLVRMRRLRAKALMSGEKEQNFTIKIPPGRSVATTTTTATSAMIGVLSSSPPAPVAPLETVEYEAGMFFGALEILRDRPELLAELVLKNAVVEDVVLHARSLCGVFLDEPRDDDIGLSTLFPDLRTNPGYTKLSDSVSRLRTIYGESKTPGSHRHRFNKMVMHSTVIRGAYGLYDKPLSEIEPGRLCVYQSFLWEFKMSREVIL